jgi:hypothetical protein
MTTLLNTRSFTFRSDDELNETNSYCNVTVTIELMQYSDEKKYYHINYKYDLSNCSDTTINSDINKLYSSHPFYEYPHIDSESHIGEIVFYNEMTEKMIEYLLMPDEELKKVCGLTSTQKYRKLIMVSLSQFWD